MQQDNNSSNDFAAQLFTPVPTKRASEIIYEQIRERILDGSLSPGDRLPSERKMMEMFERSRPTIREALRMLERSGLVQTTGGTSGATIQTPSTLNAEQSLEAILHTQHVTLADLSEYRHVTEAAVSEWAAERRNEEDLVALYMALQNSEQELDDYVAFTATDTRFHEQVAKAAKNPVAVMMTQVLSNVTRRILRSKMQNLSAPERVDMCRNILHMHQDVYAAIEKQDVPEARAAMERHTGAFFEDLHDLNGWLSRGW